MKFLIGVILIGFVGCALASAPGMARYDDFKVYKVHIKEEQQLAQFKTFRDILPVRKDHRELLEN